MEKAIVEIKLIFDFEVHIWFHEYHIKKIQWKNITHQ